ncbi:MAG: alpha/beta hydrolase [Planctomycetes bacterium]|nr:alpha/beta hydrolase [Planctomycetota bacterium]
MPRSSLSALSFLFAFAACSTVQDDLSRQLLRPPPGWLAEPADAGLAAEPFEIVLHSAASLTGFWIPNERADKRTVVVFHDEQSNCSVLHPYYTFLHEAGFQVLVFDPRGFGRSKGTPTLQAWIHDLPELLAWLRARPDFDPARTAYFGTGLGSVAALWAARTQHQCGALVLEHVPSPRAIVKEGVADDGSAMSAFTAGLVEYAGMPDDIEPEEGAPRLQLPALFLGAEFEPARDRVALAQTFRAYGGQKQLWMLPATHRAPHTLLKNDGEYQRRIGAFLHAALGGASVGVLATCNKASDAGDGQSWYDVQMTGAPADARTAVEACAVLADGSPRFARAWLEHGRGRVRMKLPSAPLAVGAADVAAAVADPELVWRASGTRLARSTAAIEPLLPRIEELRNDALGATAKVELADALQAAEAAEPFHPQLAAELTDVFARLGATLQASDDAQRRQQGSRLLQRAVAAVPQQPLLHFWAGTTNTYGFPQEDAVRNARALLAAPAR